MSAQKAAGRARALKTTAGATQTAGIAGRADCARICGLSVEDLQHLREMWAEYDELTRGEWRPNRALTLRKRIRAILGAR